MAPKLNSGTTANGVIVHQDHLEDKQFHYYPARSYCVLDDTLKSFEVNYWGLNSSPYYIDLGGGDFRSSVGGILSGKAAIDITDAQRNGIVNAVKRDFGIDNPRMLPLKLTDVKVQPIIADNVVKINGNHTSFPTELQFGQEFNYVVSAENSLFAELVAQTTDKPQVRPSFGVNLTGDAEFQGDPWIADITCDLRQVWSYTRTQVSVGVDYYWVDISASYENIVEDLVREGIVKIKFTEGSGESQFARQMFEMAKNIFEQINKMAMSGDGFFKFEPNPMPSGGSSPGGSSMWPWSVSINASYSHAAFTQQITYKVHLEYSGKVKQRIGGAMELAVTCSNETAPHFHDYQDLAVPCLTQKKIDGLQGRIKREAAAKQQKALDYLKKLESGDWDDDKYRKMIAILRTITLTEGIDSKFDSTGKRIGFFPTPNPESAQEQLKAAESH